MIPAAPPVGSCAIKPDAKGHVTIPSDWGNISFDSFSGCESLVSIAIPNSVLEIGESVRVLVSTNNTTACVLYV